MRKPTLKAVSCALLLLFFLPVFSGFAAAEGLPFEVQARSALLMDYDTGTILYEKSVHEKLPIASLTKIMTILLALEAVEAGRLKLEDKVVVSEYAASMGGSQVFLSPGEELTVDALLKAIVVASGNDASVAIAEKIAGTHEVFVSRMNERALSLGMKNTHYANTTGLPAEDAYSTAQDVALVSRELLRHPLFFRWSTIWTDTLEESKNKTSLANTNRLVRFYDGGDGIKTGSTQEAKYCLSATAKRGNMRLLSVVLAAPSTQIRFGEAQKLMDYGFANFESVPLIKAGQTVAKEVPVSRGRVDSIQGVAAEDVSFLNRIGSPKEYEKVTEVAEDLRAPIVQRQKIGTLKILQEGQVLREVDIVAKEAVEKAYIWDYFKKIFSGWHRKAAQ